MSAASSEKKSSVSDPGALRQAALYQLVPSSKKLLSLAQLKANVIGSFQVAVLVLLVRDGTRTKRPPGCPGGLWPQLASTESTSQSPALATGPLGVEVPLGSERVALHVLGYGSDCKERSGPEPVALEASKGAL
jgi:hypothetical protein